MWQNKNHFAPLPQRGRSYQRRLVDRRSMFDDAKLFFFVFKTSPAAFSKSSAPPHPQRRTTRSHTRAHTDHRRLKKKTQPELPASANRVREFGGLTRTRARTHYFLHLRRFALSHAMPIITTTTKRYATLRHATRSEGPRSAVHSTPQAQHNVGDQKGIVVRCLFVVRCWQKNHRSQNFSTFGTTMATDYSPLDHINLTCNAQYHKC